MSGKPTIRTLCCNVFKADSVCREGAFAFVMQFAGDRAWVWVRSRSGRWVRKWMSVKALRNFRCKNIPPEHPQYEKVWPTKYDDAYVARINEECGG